MLAPSAIEEAIKAYRENKPQPEIQRLTGIGRRRLRRIIEVRGIERRSPAAPLRRRKCLWCGAYPGRNLYCNKEHKALAIQDAARKNMQRRISAISGLRNKDAAVKLGVAENSIRSMKVNARKLGVL